MDFDNPPEEIASPALTPGEIHQRPPQVPEPRRPAAGPAAGPEAQRPQPTPEPVPQPPVPQPLPPSVEAPEPKRERAAPAAPRPTAAAAPPPKPTPSDENNLAEMSQRLEAALRRPTRPEPPSPPPVRPQAPAGRRSAKPDAAGPAKVSGKSPDVPPPDFKVLSGKGKSEPDRDSLEDELSKIVPRSGKP